MLKKVALTILFISFLSLEVFGQTRHKEFWQEIANESTLIIVGTPEEDYGVIIPEKFSPFYVGSIRDSEIYAGRVFRVKVTKILRGKIKAEKVGKSKYINIFTYWVSGTGSLTDTKMFEGTEYIFFLKPNNEKGLEGKETVEFKAGKVIRKPFDNKSSYVVVQSFRGVIPTRNEKEKLIKEIKKAID